MQKKILVITNQRGYNEHRNFLGRETKKYKVYRVRDLNSISFALFKLIINHSSKILLQCYSGFSFKKHDLVHLWNGISFRKQPFVSTLEMPDYMGYKEGSYLLSLKRCYWKSKYCKKIIFISDWAQKHTLLAWREYYDDKTYFMIKNKCTILHPPQKLPVSIKRKDPVSCIKLLFVGRDFYRKGGLELLYTVNKLTTEKKMPLELTIISSMNLDDWPINTPKEKHQKALNIIKNNKSIFLHDSLPNKEVLFQMQNSHILCFPTYLDTYGYVILEAMAYGTPVIATNQRALTEVINNNTGWLLNMPLNSLDSIDRSTDNLRLKNHHLLCNLLEETLTNISQNKEVIDEKSKACYEYIKENHNFDTHANKLGTIYKEAITN